MISNIVRTVSVFLLLFGITSGKIDPNENTEVYPTIVILIEGIDSKKKVGKQSKDKKNTTKEENTDEQDNKSKQ